MNNVLNTIPKIQAGAEVRINANAGEAWVGKRGVIATEINARRFGVILNGEKTETDFSPAEMTVLG